MGLGHAVLTAREAVENEPFVVILPDDIITHAPGAVSQILEVAQRFGPGVVAVEPVPWEVVHNYGVVEGSPVEERVQRVRRLLEKTFTTGGSL